MSTQQQQSTNKSLSPAYLEAQTILTHLLTTLQLPSSPYNTAYSPWIARHGIPQLTTSILSYIRPPVWTVLSSSRWSLDSLKLISPHPGDLRYEGRAIYLNGVLGVDKKLRVYVGQTTCLRQRVGQHLNFRYRRDHPSLHYWGLQWSVYNIFAVLCVLPNSTGGSASVGTGMDEAGLAMNVLEMLMCLMFRSLPMESLREWLPSVVSKERRVSREGVVGGLNIACPLDQEIKGMDERQFVNLSDEEDELIQDWLRVIYVEKELENMEREYVEMRKKLYTEKARGYNKHTEQESMYLPNWVVLGAAAVVVGFVLFRSNGGPRR
ncbi:hypothetical protein GMOD_00002754 [Pyrenophora seminiperda CCB06]|uniref:Uncharacterized protein n=1 Tax=Pyrenophora seminiperda CCB06 TaxID=1302712 RepID=A0A3M7M370_9PLEO|nr:hypothetical protein GMOD_00002754 [Pyrenophora seminiperda CCB06]